MGLPKFEVISWRGIEVFFGSRLKGLEKLLIERNLGERKRGCS